MFVLVFVLMLVTVAGMGVGIAIVASQIVTDRTTGCTTQACANSRTGPATQAVADH
jgi:hypothetical protein